MLTLTDDEIETLHAMSRYALADDTMKPVWGLWRKVLDSTAPTAPETAKVPSKEKLIRKLVRASLETNMNALLGALISMSRVRLLMGLDKTHFDLLMMSLAQDDIITLHAHDHPHGVKKEDRDSMVKSGDTYYIGFVFNEGRATPYLPR